VGCGRRGEVPVIEPEILIPWWGWVVIWGGLVLALAIVLGLFAWWLFRKFLVLLDDVAELADRSALLEVDDPVLVAPAIAVLADVRDIRDREAARRAHRLDRKRQRRERLIARGRRITSAAAAQREWPSDWVS
jgi:hypothetical protein